MWGPAVGWTTKLAIPLLTGTVPRLVVVVPWTSKKFTWPFNDAGATVAVRVTAVPAFTGLDGLPARVSPLTVIEPSEAGVGLAVHW